MIHCFERAGLYLVLDVGSGAVHMLDEPAWALLSAMGEADVRNANVAAIPAELAARYDRELLSSALDELALLAGQNLLYADDDYTEFAPQLGEAPVKAMCLHMAHDCNLRCRYCFAATGNFGGQRELMGLDVAQKAIDLLIELSENRHNLEVDFFGGEPLMNFEVVKQTVAYAREKEKQHNKNFRFTITTNGLGLNDEIIQYINREMGNVVLSIDGRKQVHDNMRPTPSGKGSYDVIVPKFQQLVRQRGEKEYYVRGTYTRENLDFSKDVLELEKLGFDQISVEPVVGPQEDDYSIRPEDIKAIEQSYEELMGEMIARNHAGERRFNFFHFMLDLEGGPCAIKRLKGCGSGNEYVAITPNGDIYPCHQFAGDPSFIMGTVNTGITKPEIKKEFSDANLLNKPNCQNCWAKYYCSGGCNANNHQFEGSIYTPHQMSCEIEKLRLECAIAVQASKYQ